jgi:hypothetical protein
MRPHNVRSLGSSNYIASKDKIIFDVVTAKLTLKKQEALKLGKEFLYTKAYKIEDELLEDDPEGIISKMNSIYRRQVITKSCKLFGFERQGKHNHFPLLILRLS